MAITTKNIQSLQAQCRIIWMPIPADYNVTMLHRPPSSAVNVGSIVPDLTASFSQALAYDLSAHLEDGLTYNKFMDSAAGSFSFRLDNSRDWTATIHPGQWCLIYMANDGSLNLNTSQTGGPQNLIPNVSDLPLISNSSDSQLQQFSNNLRCIGFIERISSTSQVMDDGSIVIQYEVSGRDIGVIYEDTELYYNHFIFAEGQIAGIMVDVFTNAQKQPLDKVMKIMHDVFLFPSNIPTFNGLSGPSNSILTLGLQWLMPDRLLQILNLTSNSNNQNGTFYGSLKNITNFTPSLLPISVTDPFSWLKGNMWQKLKEMSLPAFNELFVEIYNGAPQLIFRPLPWGIDSSGYPSLIGSNISFIPSFYSLISGAYDNGAVFGFPSSNVVKYSSDIGVKGFDLGRDNHSRYNYFLCRYADLQAAGETVSILQTNASPGGRQFPYMSQTDLMRFGLRLREEVVNSFSFVLAINGQNDLISRLRAAGNGEPSSQFLLQYNEVLRDYWQNAIFFESGSIEQVGDPNIKIGKALTYAPSILQLGNKAYYIEGYTDRFSIGGNGETEWSQSIQVTRGIDMTMLQQASTGSIDSNVVNPSLTQAEKTQRVNPLNASFIKKM